MTKTITAVVLSLVLAIALYIPSLTLEPTPFSQSDSTIVETELLASDPPVGGQ